MKNSIWHWWSSDTAPYFPLNDQRTKANANISAVELLCVLLPLFIPTRISRVTPWSKSAPVRLMCARRPHTVPHSVTHCPHRAYWQRARIYPLRDIYPLQAKSTYFHLSPKSIQKVSSLYGRRVHTRVIFEAQHAHTPTPGRTTDEKNTT